MKGWKVGGIVSFSIITIIYGIIVYVLSTGPDATATSIFTVLKTYPIIILIFVPVGVVIGLIVSAIMFFLKQEKGKKKGQIWVSSVLYIALGIVAMTLILGAGIPMITRMKDRNTFIESKIMMHTIQDHISTVVSEGPGSRRVLDPVIIKGGKLIFETSSDKERVRWEMKTSTLLMEPCEPNTEGICSESVQSEGGLKFYLAETFVVDEYIINIILEPGVNLAYSEGNEITGSLTGNYVIAISNEGTTAGKITVGILIS